MNDIKKWGARYYQWGANVLAIPEGSKGPNYAWKQWHGRRQTVETARALPWKYAAGVGAVSGSGEWRCIDIDDCTTWTPVERILDALKLPHTYRWVVRSGSGAGWHIWLRCDEDGAFPNKTEYLPHTAGMFDHVELRWAAHQTILPPSSHADTGKPYQFHNEPPEQPPALVSAERIQAALKAVGRLKREERTPGAAPPKASQHATDEERVREALSCIPTRPEYEDWVRIVAAVLDAVGGNEQTAEALLKEWSPEEKPGEYARKFRNGLEKVTAGTLFHIAKQHGYNPNRYEPNGSTRPAPEATRRPAEKPKEAPKKEPLPFESFPLDALPERIQGYVRACAAAIPCAPAFIALPVLATLSAAIGSKARLQVKRGWLEPATLWTVLIAPSGSAKTPAMDQALRPVYRMESEARDRFEYALQQYEAAIEQGSEDAPEPVRTRYRTGDATPEAVIKILRDNPQGVLLARDELAAWIGSFDRYANGAADLQFWIEVHGGKQVSNDRVKSGNVTIDRPAVAVTGTIQPGTLKDKLGEIHFDTGFAARLLLAMPPATPKRWTDADVSPAVRSEYERVLEQLYELPREDVALNREARNALKAFVNVNGEEVFEMKDGPGRAVGSKTETHALRLSLVLHLARYCSRETESLDADAESIRRGIRLARWLRDETLRVYDALELATEAVPPIRRFARLLPDRFETADALQLAEQEDIPRRTVFDWLGKLVEDGYMEKPKRGHYQKTPPIALCTNRTNASESATSAIVHPTRSGGNGDTTPYAENEPMQL